MAKENKQRILYVRNEHGIVMKRICASCQHRVIDRTGKRVCGLTKHEVEQKHRCRRWQMSDGMKNAGRVKNEE